MSGSGGDTNSAEEEQHTAGGDIRDLVGRIADLGRSGFDEGVVDLLSTLLETETSTRIYVYLRKHPGSTGDDVADGTGLYPTTVEHALEDLLDGGAVERRESEPGDADDEYVAVPPSELVGGALQGVPGMIGDVTDDIDSTIRDEADDPSARLEVDSGTSAEAEVGETEADVDTDWEGEAELDGDDARVEGEAGGEVDVDTADRDVTVEGGVDAEVGTERVDLDVDAAVDTPDDDAAVDAEVEAPDDGGDDVEVETDVETPDGPGGDDTDEVGDDESDDPSGSTDER